MSAYPQPRRASYRTIATCCVCGDLVVRELVDPASEDADWPPMTCGRHGPPPERRFEYLDRGVLDIGIIPQSTVARNDFTPFFEEFKGAVAYGIHVREL